MVWEHITNFDTQRNDDCGKGDFGADRGPNDIHEGEDILVNEGDPVYSPIDGVVTRDGQPYQNDPFYRLIEVQGTGIHAGQTVKIMYAVPFETGVTVQAGVEIGTAQAISDKYSCEMLDHLHIRLELNGVLTNPAPYLYNKTSQDSQSNGTFGLLVFGFLGYKILERWMMKKY